MVIILITFLFCLISMSLQGVMNINCIKSSVKYDLTKHFFTNRVVSLWNSLPNAVVDSDY